MAKIQIISICHYRHSILLLFLLVGASAQKRRKHEKRIDKVSRFIYLLGVRTAVNRLKERANECLDAIHDKYKDALVNVVELQRKMGI